MTPFIQSFLRWAPRALAVLQGLLLSIFAFDEPFGGTAFFMHLLPGLVVLVGIVLVWNRSFAGGLLFLAFAIGSVFFFHTYQSGVSFLLITLPLLIISGLLFGSALIRMREID